jgi:hypothetical protein
VGGLDKLVYYVSQILTYFIVSLEGNSVKHVKPRLTRWEPWAADVVVLQRGTLAGKREALS